MRIYNSLVVMGLFNPFSLHSIGEGIIGILDDERLKQVRGMPPSCNGLPVEIGYRYWSERFEGKC
jgi:hypothetical protein